MSAGGSPRERSVIGGRSDASDDLSEFFAQYHLTFTISFWVLTILVVFHSIIRRSFLATPHGHYHRTRFREIDVPEDFDEGSNFSGSGSGSRSPTTFCERCGSPAMSRPGWAATVASTCRWTGGAGTRSERR